MSSLRVCFFFFCYLVVFMGLAEAGKKIELTEWKLTSSMLSPRSGAASVEHGGFIYVFGGVSMGDTERGFLNTAEMTRINKDGSLGEWTALPVMNYERAFASAAVLNDYIYLLGGSNSGNWMNTLKQVERVRIFDDGSLGVWEKVSRLTTPRRGVCVAAFENTIYAIGGYNGLFLKTVEVATVDSDNNISEWKVLPSVMTTGRYIHGSASIGNRIVVVGGHRMGDVAATGSSEWADIGADGTITHWTSWAPLKNERFLVGVAAVKGVIVAAGGYNGEYLSSVEIASAPLLGVESEWVDAPDLRTGRAGALVASYEDFVYIIGGSQKEKYLNEVEYARLK